ncbi:MAG TPA: ADP-ribose pyrophosphatase, partial [Clostridiales bacterium]|nr:ADP-ribose pyrophosphatase [Clostridiales bacterium]
MKYQEDKIDGKEIYNGKVISLRVDRVKLPNGKESFREEISHNGGVGVLVVKDGKALIVKQFRYAYKEELAEIPAGKL